MEKTITVKTPEGEIIPVLSSEEVLELEMLANKGDPILGLENDEEEVALQADHV